VREIEVERERDREIERRGRERNKYCNGIGWRKGEEVKYQIRLFILALAIKHPWKKFLFYFMVLHIVIIRDRVRTMVWIHRLELK